MGANVICILQFIQSSTHTLLSCNLMYILNHFRVSKISAKIQQYKLDQQQDMNDLYAMTILKALWNNTFAESYMYMLYKQQRLVCLQIAWIIGPKSNSGLWQKMRHLCTRICWGIIFPSLGEIIIDWRKLGKILKTKQKH